MNLDEFSDKIMTNEEIEEFIKELEERLKNMENEIKKYTIDRFEGEYAICEDRNTMEMINILKSFLPENAKEGTVLKYEKGEYSVDIDAQNQIEDRIKKKMDDLWN